jgi:hypothetical protein
MQDIVVYHVPLGELDPAEVEALEDAEQGVDAKEEVVAAHALNVDQGHDELLVLVLEELGLEEAEGGGQHGLHDRVGKVGQPTPQLPKNI